MKHIDIRRALPLTLVLLMLVLPALNLPTLLPPAVAQAQTWNITCPSPGAVVSSPDGMVALICGNSPNVMSVPHDGWLWPASMARRTREACDEEGWVFNTSRDAEVSVFGRYIADAYHAQSGKHLWRVVSRLSRAYADMNRPVRCAAGNDPAAIRAWEYYHQAIQYAVGQVSGRGFYWDLHSNTSHDARIELFFGLPRAKMFSPGAHAAETSLSAFAATHQGSFTTLYRDLGTRLRNAGYPAIPSQSQWEPEPGDGFYDFGYSTDRHGCSQVGDQICGVQVEIHKGIKSLNTTGRQAFAATFAKIMRDYVRQFGITW